MEIGQPIKIISACKSKNKEENNNASKTQEIHIALEKHQQIIDDLRLFYHCIEMIYQNIKSLLGSESIKVYKFITKNRQKFIFNLAMKIIDRNQPNK